MPFEQFGLAGCRLVGACTLICCIGALHITHAAGSSDSLPEGVFGSTEAARLGEPGQAVLSIGVTGRERRGMTTVAREANASATLTNDFALRFGGWSAPVGMGRVEPDGLSLEIVHRLWSGNRTAASLAITPSWSRWSEFGGESGETTGLDAVLRLESTLVPGRLFAAANLGVSTSRETGVLFQDPSTAPAISTQLDASAAIAGRLAANLYLAVEARVAAAADGTAVSLSAGPSVNLRLSEQATLSASFTPRVGASGDPDGLSENRFQLELSVEF